jgi:hypothetical protein
MAIGMRNLACRLLSVTIGSGPQKVVSVVSMIGRKPSRGAVSQHLSKLNAAGVCRRDKCEVGRKDGQYYGHSHLPDSLYGCGGPVHALPAIDEYILADDNGIVNDETSMEIS